MWFDARMGLGRSLLGLVVALTAIASGSASAAAPAPPAIDLADMFLVEDDGGWFCNSAKQANNATCPEHHVSRLAAQDLIAALTPSSPDLYLRVAKARSDCTYDPAGGGACSTGVPSEPCAADVPFKTPACTLGELSRRGIKLGIVIGALGDASKVRSVRDVTWHACQVSRADKTQFYDFVFLDAAWRLGDRLRRTVRLMQAGQYALGNRDLPCPDAAPGHPVITNDTSWQRGRAANTSLDNGAWAHAKRVGILDGENDVGTIQRAARGSADGALTSQDKAFVAAVRAVGSIPVLRLEVPSQSSRFARLQTQVQCSLLARWSSLQGVYGYTLIHPLYVHGAASGQKAKSSPYDSFVEGTFVYQAALMNSYPSGTALPADFCGSRTANIPCGTVVAPSADPRGVRLQITKTSRAHPDPVSCGAARRVIHSYWRTARVPLSTPRRKACSRELTGGTTCVIGRLLWVCNNTTGAYDTSCTAGNRIGWAVVARPASTAAGE